MRNVLSPGWDTPRIPGAPAGSDMTTPVGVTWIRVTQGCIAPVAIAWGTRWWRRAEVCAARRSNSICGGTFRLAPVHATTWATGITWTIRWVRIIWAQQNTNYSAEKDEMCFVESICEYTYIRHFDLCCEIMWTRINQIYHIIELQKTARKTI